MADRLSKPILHFQPPGFRPGRRRPAAGDGHTGHHHDGAGSSNGVEFLVTETLVSPNVGYGRWQLSTSLYTVSSNPLLVTSASLLVARSY